MQIIYICISKHLCIYIYIYLYTYMSIYKFRYMSGIWGPSLRDFWHSGDEDGVWGLEGVREKVARVTVSGVWNEKEKRCM